MLPIDISKSEIIQCPILQLVERGSDKTTVFLPNYGEFGSTIHKLIKLVYFFDCPKKIVCCRKGEEAYFPNADDFYYDWEDFVEEKHKWGFFTKRSLTGIEKNHRYREYKNLLTQDVNNIKKALGEDCNYIPLWTFKHTPIFEKYHSHFVFDFKPIKKQGAKADVVISPRNRSSRQENNFLEWDGIINVLNENGYSVGCVGSKNQSLNLSQSRVNSWDYDDNASAVIELFSNCKLYLGLDTGVSHLAAFMSIPMIVFSHSAQNYYLTSYMAEINKNYFLDLGKSVKDISTITNSVLNFLNKVDIQLPL